MDFETYARDQTRALLRLAAALTNDPGLGEDLVQEVLIRAHQRWATISALPYPHAYVRKMVSNEFLSWHRKWGRISVRPLADLDRGAPDPATLVDARDELRQEISRLPAKQRAAVVLRYFEDLSDADIADILGCRAVTVRGYLHRALRSMKVSINAERSATTGSDKDDLGLDLIRGGL